VTEASTLKITTYKREYNEIPIWNGVIGGEELEPSIGYL
jgi:hypothetical protein